MNGQEIIAITMGIIAIGLTIVAFTKNKKVLPH